jgi:hypothetical protein
MLLQSTFLVRTSGWPCLPQPKQYNNNQNQNSKKTRSPKVDGITTLVLDLEGSDGRERGEDDTNFERQAALFALSVADVLLVNIWCHDIGREQGSGKPLMKTIFQVREGVCRGVGRGYMKEQHEVCIVLHTTPTSLPPFNCTQVNLKLFAPEPNRRRTVLLFVIRDKSKTPLSKVRGRFVGWWALSFTKTVHRGNM